MKFINEPLDIPTFFEISNKGYTKCSIEYKDTGYSVFLIGKFPFSNKYVFYENITDRYIEIELKDIPQKLILVTPSLETNDWIAVINDCNSTAVTFKQMKSKKECYEYNDRDDWRNVTQAEWEQLNKPILSHSPQSISLSLSIEEAIKVLQKRIEETVAGAVKEAFTECKKKRDVKFTDSSTEKQCENNWV